MQTKPENEAMITSTSSSTNINAGPVKYEIMTTYTPREVAGIQVKSPDHVYKQVVGGTEKVFVVVYKTREQRTKIQGLREKLRIWGNI